MSSEPMSTSPTNRRQFDAVKAERLTELSEFLKSCRNRTKPEACNLPIRPRRRSLGLSRAEVAALATISVDWYTWLEQGRDIQPSNQVLEKLAEVFQLTGPERRHLYFLSARPSVPSEAPNIDIQLMRRAITHMPEAPAIILRKDWQILAQNSCADKFFSVWAHVSKDDRNLLYLFFTDPVFTEYLRRWEWHARLAIRQFRAIYATEIGNPIFVSLIERLSAASSQFNQWWAGVDVMGRDDGRKEFDHPLLGYRDYDYTILRPTENQAVEVIAFIPRAVRVKAEP